MKVNTDTRTGKALVVIGRLGHDVDNLKGAGHIITQGLPQSLQSWRDMDTLGEPEWYQPWELSLVAIL
ncbi:hypothetical protein BOTBODRAFT_469579 [Botryobasidium botryosum FD-172 SS1]|uniref:Uncharacterized protein n=1 Tax=Botryobasidium botryosum (strain FD-172 SS1) TaxID=930990 RepID=A0A067MHF4_BOTB1|nr:hypothetical protein BOTBODRAFT_469579 [Botryobasidium botryosum FD-172 SS1]